MELKKSRYTYLLYWLNGYKGTLSNVLLSSILVTFLGMNWPLVYRYIINRVFYNGSMNELGFIFIIYILLFFSEKLLQFIWKLSEAVMASDFTYSVKRSIYKKFFSLSVKDKEKYRTGEILDIINNDVNQMYTFLIDEGVFAVTCCVRLIMAVVYIFLINKWAAAFILLLVIVNYFISRYLKDRLMKYYRKYKVKLEEYNIYLLDVLSGLKEIKLFSAARYMKEKFLKRTLELCGLQEKQLYEDNNREVVNEIMNIISVIILYIAAAYAIVNGQMLLGDFVSLMIYYEWAKIFFSVFAQLFSGASKSFVSIDRMNELMKLESEKMEGEEFQEGDIEVNNLHFSYKEGEEVLKGVSLSIKEKETVAIVGSSGSGKSTFVNLLLKFYAPGQGEIKINGRDITRTSSRDLRESIGIVSQNAGLFEESIRNNLLLGKMDAIEEELWRVLELVHMKEFVQNLPEKLDTLITASNNLSTGQIQRIVLARTLLKDPKILILDEATSNIDLQTEEEFLKDAREVMKEKTVIIIAYRVNSLKIADKIYYLGYGEIKDSGSHDELYQGCKGYRELIYIEGGEKGNGENKNYETAWQVL